MTQDDLNKMGLVKQLNGTYRKMTKAEKLAPSKPTARERLFAKGRLKNGEMNKTEAAYCKHLEALKQQKKIAWYLFESIKLKLADLTYLTVDFAVMMPDGMIQFHDVKGAKILFQDDAKVKMKVAAEKFPFEFYVVYPKKEKDGGGWNIEQVNP